MNCTHFKSYYPSSDGLHKIAYYVRFPIGTVRGVVQISHGMCEYFRRYDDLAEFLTGLGFAVCGNDHLGHGDSVNDSSELGYFSPEHGWENAVEDMYTLTKMMKHNYPDKPYFLLGHSMGSFLARAFVTKHGRNLTAAIFCGTSGGMEGITALLTVVDSLKILHGDKYRSKAVNKLAFGAYTKKITDKVSEYDWISRDPEIVSTYEKDPKCNFIFTLNGFENLAKLLWYVSNEKWFSTYPKTLPTYLIAGSADPVGNYGKGVLSVFNRLSLNGCDVEMKIYENARHELVNETNRREVYNDIADFLLDIISSEMCSD